MPFAAAALLALGAAAFWWWNKRATVLTVSGELPDGFPERGFSHDELERLLSRFVRSGRVDYAAWSADRDARRALDRYLGAVARYSPHNAPERFPGEGDRQAYWLCAYNAFVIKGVLERWPLASVTDVKAPVELVKGLGFFYTLEFVAGGRHYNLFDLERLEIVGTTRDPRAHFVLNCGSGGCPVLRPELPRGEELEPFLAQAAADFVADPLNLRIDHERRRIELSAIFRWHRRDFLAELRRRGLPSQGLHGYLALVAREPLASELARAVDYAIEFRDYDWSINAT